MQGTLADHVSLWNVEKAINAINETYELDLTLDVWNDRAVSLPHTYSTYVNFDVADANPQHIILSEMIGQTQMYACSGGVWTETSDVEGEVNGLVT